MTIQFVRAYVFHYTLQMNNTVRCLFQLEYTQIVTDYKPVGNQNLVSTGHTCTFTLNADRFPTVPKMEHASKLG